MSYMKHQVSKYALKKYTYFDVWSNVLKHM